MPTVHRVPISGGHDGRTIGYKSIPKYFDFELASGWKTAREQAGGNPSKWKGIQVMDLNRKEALILTALFIREVYSNLYLTTYDVEEKILHINVEGEYRDKTLELLDKVMAKFWLMDITTDFSGIPLFA